MDEGLEILLRKYREGKLSIYEELEMADKISDLSSNKFTALTKEDWYSSLNDSNIETKSLDNTLHKIHHKIHLKENATSVSKRHKIYRWASQAVAVLFIPLLAVSLYFIVQNRLNIEEISKLEIVSPPGARINFELPDGTVGVLNGGSTISYSSAFVKNRHVDLDGEVYLDVVHDKSNPFTVKGNNNFVQVVGTKFTFSAYSDEPTTELVLEEGKVLFNSHKQKSQIEIEKGQRVVEVDGKIRRSMVDVWKYTAWKEGKLVFRNDNMAELARRISRWYDVEVEVEGEDLNDYTFRGVFENDSLEEVLHLLKMTSPISYRIVERMANPDGTFTRKKVILSKI